MKKVFLTTVFVLTLISSFAQITVTSALVPLYVEGNSPTNNNRIAMWFWADLAGLTPGATYHYYTSMDTLGAPPNANGSGNPYLVDPASGVIRRTTNPSMSSAAGYDSIVINSNGTYAGWFGVESTGNGRFLPGNIILPQIQFNNGAGGTTVATRVRMIGYPVTVINFGTTANSPTQGSALYDSLDATPKNLIALYDNVAATGRPVNIAIVEDDGVSLGAVAQIAPFYKNLVDSMPMHWGAIIPNNLPNGIRALEERSFSSGAVVDVVTDADGFWCSGVNTANMTNGLTAEYLNSTFSLSTSASIPDTAYTAQTTGFSATSNDTGVTYTWNFGDAGTGTGASPSHVYTVPAIVTVTVIITNGGCSDTITQNVVVLLGTSIPRAPGFGFVMSPNPTDGQFTISGMRGNGDREIVVTNLLGEIIATQQTSGTTIRLDLTGYPAGVYLVRVRDEETGKTGVRKISLR